MAHDERRKHARLALSVDVDFKSRDNFYSGKTRDISEGGLFIVSDVALPVGAQLTLVVKLLGTTMQTPGEVTWVLLGDGDEVVGMGVRFLNLTSAARTKIESFMKRRTPMPFEMVESEPPPMPAPAAKAAPPPLKKPR